MYGTPPLQVYILAPISAQH